MLIVEDATRDARFLDNPFVLQDPNIRFYAGAPLQMANGEALGALCVIDTQPRQLTEQQRRALSVLCRAVVSQLELRRALADLRAAGRLLRSVPGAATSATIRAGGVRCTITSTRPSR